MPKRDTGYKKIHLFPPSSAGSVRTSTASSVLDLLVYHFWSSILFLFFSFVLCLSCLKSYALCIFKSCTLIDEAYACDAWAMGIERWAMGFLPLPFPFRFWFLRGPMSIRIQGRVKDIIEVFSLPFFFLSPK